jgi:hypothetical protein
MIKKMIGGLKSVIEWFAPHHLNGIYRHGAATDAMAAGDVGWSDLNPGRRS